MLALNSFTIEFFGKSSHAGAAPWEGVNAVDAIMQGFVNIGLLRQQTLPTNRYVDDARVSPFFFSHLEI